jgi:hypothetical protein
LLLPAHTLPHRFVARRHCNAADFCLYTAAARHSVFLPFMPNTPSSGRSLTLPQTAVLAAFMQIILFCRARVTAAHLYLFGFVTFSPYSSSFLICGIIHFFFLWLLFCGPLYCLP